MAGLKKDTSLSTEKENTESLILWLEDISLDHVAVVGYKHAFLGDVYTNFSGKGISIPNAFVTTVDAYWKFLQESGIYKDINDEMKRLHVRDARSLARSGKKIRKLIMETPFSDSLEKDIIESYRMLSKESGERAIAVAVRPSVIGGGGETSGQQEAFLNIKGEKDLIQAVKKCIASLFTQQAMITRHEHAIDHLSVGLSVSVQRMINADKGVSGTVTTMDIASGFDNVCLIHALYGLGNPVSRKTSGPDEFCMFKEGVRLGYESVIGKTLGSKEHKIVSGKTKGTVIESVPEKERDSFTLIDEETFLLTTWSLIIEEQYNAPQIIEWVKESKTGNFFVLQVLPIKKKTQGTYSFFEQHILKQEGEELLRGIPVGRKIGAGTVRIINTTSDIKECKSGEVLVIQSDTNSEWEPAMNIASAIIVEYGDKTSHAAKFSSEKGIPCIVGALGLTNVLSTGDKVTVSCANAGYGVVYKSILPFEVKRTDYSNVPETKTQIMINLGDPDHAFDLSFLPTDGVGLIREESIFDNNIHVHPLALIQYKTLKNTRLKKQIADITKGYKRKTDYLVAKLAEGIGRIAASMHPNEVVFRLSDIGEDTFSNLVGAQAIQKNSPRKDFIGVDRFYSKEYKSLFEYECRAIKRARDQWGLKNIVVLIPFCKTPAEGESMLKKMARFGLKQGKDGLKVYVMCEIPSNVVLAEEFATLFDGFSLGSKDASSVALGIEDELSGADHVYNEKNKISTKVIKDVIDIAHKHGKTVGISGEIPHDYPGFTEFLIRAGIDSISLDPDAMLPAREHVGFVENTVGRKGRKMHMPVLGLLLAWGALAVGFVALGAGCGGVTTSPTISETATQEISPGAIREKLEKKIQKDKEQEIHNLTAPLSVDTFAQFRIQYPSRWGVEHWNGGLTLRDLKTGEYVSIFKQLVGHPVPDNQKRHGTVDGYPAVRYADTFSKDGSPVEVIEISFENIVLEFNTNSASIDDILDSLEFTSSTLTSDRPATHWDVREGRFCVQMITYARVAKDSSCQVFSTPCDVPKGWQVCDSTTINN